MSRPQLSRTLLGAAAGLTCAAALVPSSASAAVTQAQLLKCNFPTVGDVNLDASWTLDPPAQYQTGVPSPSFPIGVKLSVGDAASTALAGIDGLASMSVGVAKAEVPTYSQEGESADGKLTFPQVPAELPISGTGDLSLSTTYPGKLWRQPAMAGILFANLTLNLTARDADGAPIPLPQGLGLTPFGGWGPLAETDADPNTFDVACYRVYDENAPNELAEVEIVGDPIEAARPTAPTGLTATPGETSVTLTWNPSTDADGTVQNYTVYQDGLPRAVSEGATSVTIDGLDPGDTYRYAVQAEDDEYNVSDLSEELVVTTIGAPGPVTELSFALNGSTKLKTLISGSLPLGGYFEAGVTPATGAVDGELGLTDTSARLVAGGFLPITAKIGFVPVGRATGTLTPTALTLDSKVHILVKEAKLLGSIPIVTGATCQTKQPTALKLTSKGAFDGRTGGKLGGTYKISDLTGCGRLTSFVSPLTAGGGNTIDLTLAKG